MKKIKGRYISVNPFSHRPATPKKVLDVISALDDEKSSGGDNPLRILMDDKIFLQVLLNGKTILLKLASFQTL